MSQARNTEARKAPSQERSRKMVEMILQATRMLLIEDGLETLTTSRIAKKAGISVGSLYQYFPNKLAIIKALYQHWLDSFVEELESLANLEIQEMDQGWGILEMWLDQYYDLESYQRDSPEWRLEMELSKGMQLFKELHEIDTAHRWRVAEVLAIALKKFFPDKDNKTLKQVGVYLYYLSDSFDSLSAEPGADLSILLPLHKRNIVQVVKSLKG